MNHSDTYGHTNGPALQEQGNSDPLLPRAYARRMAPNKRLRVTVVKTQGTAHQYEIEGGLVQGGGMDVPR